MRLLLDTHVLLWMLSEPARIPESTLTAARTPSNELLVSAISPFEIATKNRIGKLPGVEPVLISYEEQLARLGATELPLSSRHGLRAGQLPWNHRDPFDRIIAAQALSEGVSLVTSDRAFAELAGVSVLWG
jgi:PIN domain nuclease of toxin-antitoxin system